MNEDIKKILEIAINAPSGSNSQPWKFSVKKNQIHIIALPKKDHPFLNYRNRGTWIAHGAVIENITIVASAYRYESKVMIFPEGRESNLTAIIELEADRCEPNPLSSVVPLRATNRKRYQDTPLTASQKKNLLEPAFDTGEIKVMLIEERNQKNIIGQALAVNEIVTLENEKLHSLFFQEITWSKTEEFQKKTGFYLKTLELNLAQQFLLGLIKNWKVMSFFNRIKLARKIAEDNAKTYASGAGIIAITARDRDEDFLLVGRIMERIWLNATQMGLSAHPITGTLFFWQGIRNHTINFLPKEQVDIINNAYSNITSTLGIDNGVIAFMMRVGYASKPSARALKGLPDIIWND